MKKSKSIKFGLMNGVILAVALGTACGPDVVAVDPCQSQTFNQVACQAAITNHGYYYHDVFFPMMYPYGYGWYGASYNSYIARGGQVYAAPNSMYGQNYRSIDARASNMISGAENRSGTYVSSRTMSAFSGGSGSIGGTVGRSGFGSTGAGHSSGG